MDVIREPYMVIIERPSLHDPDEPFVFGPYRDKEEAEKVETFIKEYHERDSDPQEERFVCRLGTYKAPNPIRGREFDPREMVAVLRMFMAFYGVGE